MKINYLHTMVRVRDSEESKKFYCDLLGLVETRRKDLEAAKATLVFLAPEGGGPGNEVELTYNWGVDSYEMGDAYGHIAIEVDDVYRATENIKGRGGKILRDAGPMNAGSTIIAFVEDPDGYPIELIGVR